MCYFYDQLQSMMADTKGDVLLLQSKNQDDDGIVCYGKTDAIIKNVPTDRGYSWGFYTVLSVDSTPVKGFGVLGDLETITKAAEYQFGHKIQDKDLIIVNSGDPSFPQTLNISLSA